MHRFRPPAAAARLLAVLLATACGLAGCRGAGDEPAPVASGAPAAAPPPPAAVVTPRSGTEVVPEGEAEPASPEASDGLLQRPRQSFGRAAGLHRVDDPLKLEASAALVLDVASGVSLYRKNADAVLPIASLTKLMTGLIVAEAQLPLAETLTIEADDIDTERHSRSRLPVGTRLTRGEALHLALMSSENRAAHALGRTYPGGLAAFVEAMNMRARQLGMEQTRFVDPTGLSNQNQSSVGDLAKLATAATRHRLLREYSTTALKRVEFDGRKLLYRNSNRLIMDSSWDIGLQKTGYIIEAGQCLALATRLGEREVILVLLDSATKASRGADAERLRRWVVQRDGGDPEQFARRAETATRMAGAGAARKAPPKKQATKKATAKKQATKKATAKKQAAAKKPAATRPSVTKKKEAATQPATTGASPSRVRKTYAAGQDARNR